MKIASYLHQGQESFGVVIGGGLVDLRGQLSAPAASLREVLERGLLDEVRALSDLAAPTLRLAEVTLLTPIVRPGKIVCVGINYRSRPGEFGAAAPPPYPSLFFRNPHAQVASGQPILRPPESEQLDFEGEVAIIIGRGGRRISQADAMGHVAGYACFNEGSIRDWMKHGVYNVTAGKNFDATGGFGPWMATADAFPDPAAIALETRVNGTVVQSDSTASLIFPFVRLIEYISTVMTLDPGDVIATGTPAGSGSKREPPVWLKPGDLVEVEVHGVGCLSNRVEDEASLAARSDSHRGRNLAPHT